MFAVARLEPPSWYAAIIVSHRCSERDALFLTPTVTSGGSVLTRTLQAIDQDLIAAENLRMRAADADSETDARDLIDELLDERARLQAEQ